MMEFDVLQLRGAQLDDAHKVAVWQLLTEAPEDAVPTAEDVEDVYNTSMLCHEERDCVWLFLRTWEVPASGMEDRREERMIGVAATTQRSNGSLYIFNLVVRSTYRRMGGGEVLARECQALAARRGCISLSGTVASRDKGLQRWYERLGARFVQDFVSSDGRLPPSIRMEGGFAGQDHHAALAACRARLLKNLNSHARKRRPRFFLQLITKRATLPFTVLSIAAVAVISVARRVKHATAST